MPKRFRTPPIDAPAANPAPVARREREIVEGLRDAFLSVDGHWRIADCNGRAEQILGRTRAELLGLDVWEVIGVPPDSPFGTVARRVKKTGEPEDAEITLNLNGAARLFDVRGFRIGQGVGVLAADITDVRRAERQLADSEMRFRELASRAPAPAWMTDAAGALEYANPALLHVLGHSEREVIGKDWGRQVHAEDWPPIRQAHTRHSQYSFTVRVRRGDGAWRTLQLTGVPRFDAVGAFSGHVGIASDITDVLAAAKTQQLLIDELNHRVKNTLATVQSIVRLTLKDSPGPKGAVDLLTDRLMALAQAHDLLSRQNWAGAGLSEMARLAVRHFDPEDRRIAISGPEVQLYPAAGLAVFLAINELATNATRHGSLSAPDGRVALSWREHRGAIELEWRESGGPAVTPPTRKGFGSRLLTTALAAELGAPAELVYAREGLICHIRIPLAAS
jgi:PAS domain S-box-containing protein